ncbi:MAG: MBL fold metallo-hydrolase [Rhodocyclaceae bacterium]|nr:MBL fold metallo-hydrolase [Rhodocyclaceae bacterium]
MTPRIDYGNGIHAIDATYVRHQLAAIHLIIDNGRAAFVDCGSNYSLPAAQAALSELGLTPDCVDYVLLTHIHLDHAGGAGAMMQAFPHAKLVVHPRGARHMIEPAKLWAATEEVYGSERAKALYGALIPIAAERVLETTDGMMLTLGARTLSFHDCPGHAKHHVFIHDHAARGLFTGDTFGLSYRECDVDGRAFIFPTTTPSQFDPEAMRDSVARMLACQPEAVYLTHYSRRAPPAALAADLLRRLDGMVAIARQVGAGDTAIAAIHQHLRTYLLAEARAHGCQQSDVQLLEIWDMDLELDAQGLAIWIASQTR